MISGRNIVCVASSWHDHPTSKHHLMRLLAERNHVVWVSYHASRRPQFSARDWRLIAGRLRQVSAGRQRVLSNLEVIAPPVVPLPTLPLARLLNTRLLLWRIRGVLRRLPPQPVQLWLFTPEVPEIIPALRAERVVYYCVDDFAAFDGCDAALLSRLERQTCDAADVVITTSQPLHDHCRRLHENVHLVPHGVDVEHFAATVRLGPADVPEELRRLPRPVLGYIGLIAEYVDTGLLAAVASRRPAWSFALIGTVRCPTGCLRELPNVHVLGPRPYAELPRYCRGLDVGLIPFRTNRLTHAANPIKLREYLAAGLPVVSVPLPAVTEYAPAVRVAAGVEEFISACTAALADGAAVSREQRRRLVAGESWRVRVEQVSGIVAGATARGRVPTPATLP